MCIGYGPPQFVAVVFRFASGAVNSILGMGLGRFRFECVQNRRASAWLLPLGLIQRLNELIVGFKSSHKAHYIDVRFHNVGAHGTVADPPNLTCPCSVDWERIFRHPENIRNSCALF
ncbi:hypothetical protein D3C72_2009450 [compost metagenome]